MQAPPSLHRSSPVPATGNAGPLPVEALEAAEPPVLSSATSAYKLWLDTPAGTVEKHRPIQAPNEKVLTLAALRRMKRKGRFAVVWAVVFFVIAQLAVTYTMENWLPVTFRSLLHAKERRLRAIAAEKPDRPLMVMLGSSRTEYAWEAEYFDGFDNPEGPPFLAYNYGLPSLGPLYATLSLREMLDAGIHPRLLLVEFLPPLLNEPRKNYASEEAWTAASWLNLQQLVRMWPYFKHPDRKARDWLEARLLPWYVFRREMLASVNGLLQPEQAIKITVPYDPWGHKMHEDLSHEERENRIRTAVGLFRDSLACLQIGKGPAQAWRDLLVICRREQIRVVLVAMPESTVFRSWYSAEAMNDLHDFLAKLQEHYGIDVIDASNWVADDQFIDGHHVTSDGSRVFTLRLRDELQHCLTGQSAQHAVLSNSPH